MKIMGLIKEVIRGLARRAGYSITNAAVSRVGINPMWDMRLFLKNCASPVIIDVGANTGQTVVTFKQAFPDSSIYSFEPSPATYKKLVENCKDTVSVKTWNVGVGSREASLELMEYDRSDMTSFLPPDNLSWAKPIGATKVPVITLDSFAHEHALDFIHVLKSDTQGYDFEVLKGADRLMQENRIGLVFFEFIFGDMYQGLPKFDEVFRFLSERNFQLVTFYEPRLEYDVICWTEFLFVNRAFNDSRRA
jgi:FkbM family methyltransferase